VNTLIIGAIVVSALYFGRDLFVPLALALLLSFALGPLVVSLRKRHLGRISSVAISVSFAFLVIVGVTALIGSQLASLAENLPEYRYNIIEKIQSFRQATAGNGLIGSISKTMDELKNELLKPPEQRPVKPSGRPAGPSFASVYPQRNPIPVEVFPPAETPAEVIEAVVGPMLGPLAMAGIIVVFVIFFLLQREDLRDRFIRLVGSRDLNRTTQALDDAASRLSRYLLTQCAINALFGVLIGTGLWLIGAPSPLLWGLLAMLLRFVPYIGPIIAAALPTVVIFAVEPGWSNMFWTIGLFAVVEPFMGQVLEPWLYGHTTGLSPVAVVVAAAFWTWIWGPVGLLLSTPLTLCLVVIGRHVEGLEFFNIALGNKPALAPEESFYQRMLAGDADEAAQQAEEFLKEGSLMSYYDQIALKGLILAQQDANRGALDRDRRLLLKESVDEVIADLADRGDAEPVNAAAAEGAEKKDPERAVQPRPDPSRPSVLCIGGRSALDEAVASMLAQILDNEGIGARVVNAAEVAPAGIARFSPADARIVCLSYLDAGASPNARYLIRRLRRVMPFQSVILCLWSFPDDEAALRDVTQKTNSSAVVTSLGAAVSAVKDLLSRDAQERPAASGASVHVLLPSAPDKR
jgi:predicted PurR-regulated permease PerM